MSLLKSSCEIHGFGKRSTPHEQRYCGFAGGASTGFGPFDGASADRRASADRGGGVGGVRGVPVGVRPGAAARRAPAGGQTFRNEILTGVGEVDVRVPKARSRSGSPEPFRSSVVPPYVRRCASLDAAIPWVPARGVHPDASGGRRAGGRGGRPWVVGERGQSAQAQLGRGVPPVVPAAARRRTCGRTASTAPFAASASGCACWWSLA